MNIDVKEGKILKNISNIIQIKTFGLYPNFLFLYAWYRKIVDNLTSMVWPIFKKEKKRKKEALK